MEKIPLSEHAQHRVAKAYAKTIQPLRVVARGLGYALTVHGSIKRDIDIVAIPWTDKAVEPEILAESLRSETEKIIGFAVYGNDGPWPRNNKPHGRLCWTIHFNGTYIDLSVMPRYSFIRRHLDVWRRKLWILKVDLATWLSSHTRN